VCVCVFVCWRAIIYHIRLHPPRVQYPDGSGTSMTWLA